MRKLIILFLILSPIIDYTYKLKIFSIGLLEISPNRIFKILPLILLIYSILIAEHKLFLWKMFLLLVFISTFGLMRGVLFFPNDAIDVYLRFLSSFVFFALAGKMLSNQDFHKIFRFLMFFSLIPIIISYLQFAGIIPYTDFDVIGGIMIGRVSGGYEKQVAMMSYLMYSFSFAMFYYLTSYKFFHKMLFILYIAAVFSVIVLSTHRASLVVFMLIFLYFVLLYFKKRRNLILTSFLFVFAFLLIFFNLEWVNLIFGFSNINNPESFTRGRITFWYDYINNLTSSGIFYLLFGKGHSVLDTEGDYLPKMFNEPHSDYVRILYQYGLIGLITYILFILIIIHRSIIYRRKSKVLQDKLLGDMGIIIGFSLLFYSVTIEPTRYPTFWWYYSALASYILLNYKRVSRL